MKKFPMTLDLTKSPPPPPPPFRFPSPNLTHSNRASYSSDGKASDSHSAHAGSRLLHCFFFYCFLGGGVNFCKLPISFRHPLRGVRSYLTTASILYFLIAVHICCHRNGLKMKELLVSKLPSSANKGPKTDI